MKIKDLKKGTNIGIAGKNLEVEVVSLNIVEGKSRRDDSTYKCAYAIVKDDTGEITVKIHEGQIDLVIKKGCMVRFHLGYVSEDVTQKSTSKLILYNMGKIEVIGKLGKKYISKEERGRNGTIDYRQVMEMDGDKYSSNVHGKKWLMYGTKPSAIGVRTPFGVFDDFEKNLLDMIFCPRNESELIVLFSKLHKQLGFEKILEVRPDYPDCIALKDGKEVSIEFELFSTDFRLHVSHLKGLYKKGAEDTMIHGKCDYIVCWGEDQKFNIPTIELSSCYYDALVLLAAEKEVCLECGKKTPSMFCSTDCKTIHLERREKEALLAEAEQ